MKARTPARSQARCLSLLALLSDYIDGELPARDARRITAHCRGCDRCKLMVSSLRRTVALYRATGRAPLPAAVARRARARVRALIDRIDTPRVRSRRSTRSRRLHNT
jgi:anti-sigma factor RsiW